jgi:hypothetical protein
MKDKRMFVVLDIPYQLDDEDCSSLIKELDPSYLEKKVYELVQKMLDPKADDLNQSYNSVERDSAKILSDWFADSKEKEYSLTIIGFTKEGEDVYLKMEEKLSIYDSIIIDREEICERSGIKESYKLVQLDISRPT